MHERTKAMKMRRVELGGLSQMAVARAAGIHFQRYARIENAVYDPTPEEEKAIAKALKCKRSELFELVGVGK
jgi:transcriptional regulator with XRE-family HTH domain